MPALITALVMSFAAFAGDLSHAPKPFSYNSEKAIYVDFLSAHYQLSYDIAAETATVVSTIEFEADESGFPLLDLATTPSSVLIDGASAVMASIQTPDRATTLKVINTSVTAGHHVMVITSPLSSLVDWKNGGVHSATWTTDLNDRGYLEQYMPANMEFDQVPMIFDVKFVNATKKQIIYTNGELQAISNNEFRVVFPQYFTSSSMFFHTVPEGVMAETRFDFNSIDGRKLPVVIYLKPGFLGSPDSQLERLKSETVSVLNELESDYGPFLHPRVTIYNAGSGGMEYCGATMTSLSALGHELTHSYFARGIMPANGNAGWIDEALASWRDNGYPRGSGFSGSANMAGRASYTRFTDRQAYTYGASFMSNLDNHFAANGGLKPLLRKLVEDHAFSPFFTEDFVAWGESHSRMSLMPIFKQRVYTGFMDSMKSMPAQNVHHQKLSQKELAELL
ncbi:MAG: hypothetical protein K2P81_09280 [Bacteriovoracaceae bacterium]|nr:hypothetical protein [Bacteriovoracaceae bacterium]